MPRMLYYRGLTFRKLGKPGFAVSDLTGALWLKNGLSEAERADAIKMRALAYNEAGISDVPAVPQSSFAEAPALPGQSSNTPGPQTAMTAAGSASASARGRPTRPQHRHRRRVPAASAVSSRACSGRLFERTKGGGAPGHYGIDRRQLASPGRRKLKLGRHNGSRPMRHRRSSALRRSRRRSLRRSRLPSSRDHRPRAPRRLARRRLRLPSSRVHRHRTPPRWHVPRRLANSACRLPRYARARKPTRLQGSWSGAMASNSVVANPKSTKPSSAAWAPSTGCALALTPTPRSPSSCVLRCAPTASTAWSLVRNIDARRIAEALGGDGLSSLTPGSNPWESPAT